MKGHTTTETKMRLRTKRITGTIIVDDVEIEVQQITPKEIRDLRNKHSKWVGPAGAKRQEPDDIGFGLALFKKQIVNWSNALDGDGNELECTDKNKELIFAYDQPFVADVIGASSAFFEQRQEEAEKN